MHDPGTRRHVNAMLNDLLARLDALLGEQVFGVYLDGSLALGDFDPASSDIDVVVVTRGVLEDDQLNELQELHAEIKSGRPPWKFELEAWYVPLAMLHRYDPGNATFPVIGREPDEVLHVENHHIYWLIHLHVLREHGVPLAGPPLTDLIDSVSPDDLRQAMDELMRIWWEPMIRDDTRLRQPGYLTYAILTTCRMLYTLEHGAVVSKPAAARWAMAGPASRWSGLIERALNATVVLPSDIATTQALIEFTARQTGNPGSGS